MDNTVSNIYVGTDGKIHFVKGGADSALNFSSISALDIAGSLTGSSNPHSGYFPSTFIRGNFRAIDSTTFCATQNMRVRVAISFSVGGGGTSGSSHYGIFYYNNTEYTRMTPSRTSVTFILDLVKDVPIRLYAYTVRSNQFYINMSMSMDGIVKR